MKERILLVCDGQGAGNIGAELTNKGFISYFINTSIVDLNTLSDIKDEYKYHLPTATGCNKDRKKAMQYAYDYHKHISNIIDKKFATQDIVYFIFTMGGGTGSGISPLLIDYMSRKNPDKHYGAIVILPSNAEPILALSNAVDAYNELIKIPNLKNIFMLDNNYGNKFTLNSKFVSMFDQLMCLSTPDKRGVIDEAELEHLISCKGYVLMSYIDLVSIDNRNYKDCLQESKIFAPTMKGCKYIALYTKDELSPDMLENIVGIPRDTYVGYNGKVNFMVATGMKIEEERIRIMADICECKENIRQNIEPMEVKGIDKARFNDAVPTMEKEPEVDFEKLFSKYIG